MRVDFFKKPILWGIAFFGTVCVLSVGYSAFVSNYPATATAGVTALSATEWNKMITALQALDTNLSNFSFSGGNVGIGTASPNQTVDVRGSDVSISAKGTVRGRLNLWTTTQQWWQIEVSESSGGNQNAGDLGFTESGVVGGRLVLKKGGNVGIGTINPSDTLTVNGGVTANKFTTTTAWTAVPGNGSWNSYLACRRMGSTLQFHGYLAFVSGTTSGWPVASVTLPAACRPAIDLRISWSCWSSAAMGCLVYITPAGNIDIYIWSNAFSAVAFDGTYPAD